MSLLEILPEETTLSEASVKVEEWKSRGAKKANLDLDWFAIFDEG